MHLNLAKLNKVFFFSIIIINLNISNIHSEEIDKVDTEETGIYLPFPEFKEQESNLDLKQSEDKIEADSSINKNTKSEKLNEDTKLKSTLTSNKNTAKSIKNPTISNNSKAKSNSNFEKTAKLGLSSNRNDKIKSSKDKESAKLPTKITSESLNPSNQESNSDLEMDLTEYNKTIEKIRSIEAKDSEKAINEYKSLLTKYTNPSIIAQLNIFMAWNYFHRNKNSESLEHVVAILDVPENFDLQEYPIALYLAGRIHEKNWKGGNREFAVRYYEIFLHNYNSGKENFKKSFYYPKVKEQLKALNSNHNI